MMNRDLQKERINQFVSVLQMNGHPGLRVEDCPDEHNSQSRDIDAIAGHFAIEHTSFDGLPKQREHDARFLKLVGGLREELKQHFDFQVHVIFSYGDLLDLTAQIIPPIRAELIDWLRKILPALEDGQHRFSRTPSLPFAILIRKWSSRRRGVYFMRDIPEGRIEADRLRALLKKKAEKLKLYKDKPKRYTTVLLVELNGSVFMDLSEFIELIYSLFESNNINGVDELWCVDAVDSTFAEFWKLGETPIGPFHFDLEGGSV